MRSYARSISATMLFTASLNDTFDPVGCDNATFAYTPMSEVDVQWTYKKGDKIIQMGFMNIAKFRKTLIDQMAEHKVEKLTPDFFQEFIENAFPIDEEEEIDRDPKMLFTTYLDPEGKGFITVDEIMKIPSDDIKKVLLGSETPHGPMKVEYHAKKVTVPNEVEDDNGSVESVDEKDEL